MAFYLTWASLVSILFSIAVSQALLGLALAALLLSKRRLRFPPVKLPLAVFFAATAAAVWLSADPQSGMAQIRKFFVYSVLLLVPSTFETLAQVRSLVLAWSGVASLSALEGIAQFIRRYQQAHEQDLQAYHFYIAERITGFASHWMTLGGEIMIVLLALSAFLLFSQGGRCKIYGWICVPVLAVSLLLSFTRSIFLLGVPVGMAYLMWHRKRALLAPAAALALAGVLAAPAPLRTRIVSVVRPDVEFDSNSRRSIMLRAGWEMVKAHPWFGLGPEQVGPRFLDFVPADVPRPLPKGWYGHLHNVYLQYAAERGVPAMLLMMSLIGKVLFDFRRALASKRGATEARYVLHGGVAVILAILAQGFFEYNLGDTEVLTLFLAVVSCGYVAMRAPDISVEPSSECRAPAARSDRPPVPRPAFQ